jgi:hypothetical protein
MNDKVYTLDIIKSILYSGISYEITESTREIINQISNEFNTTSPKTFVPIKKNKNIKPIGKQQPPPVPTLNYNEQIRIYLNKISDKNYDIIKKQIIDFMNNIPEEDIGSIMNTIFDIATTNRFFTKLYASLYSELHKLYPIINDFLKPKITQFMNSIEYIESGQPEIDYENFIRINEVNEKRKVVASFYYYLIEENILTTEEIILMIQHLLSAVWNYLQQENKKKYIEEIVDIVYILYNKILLTSSALYNVSFIADKNIENVILFISKCSVQETPGLTNKVRFKIMDIIDKNKIIGENTK